MSNNVKVTHELAGTRAIVTIEAGGSQRKLEVDRGDFFDYARLQTLVRTNVEEMAREATAIKAAEQHEKRGGRQFDTHEVQIPRAAGPDAVEPVTFGEIEFSAELQKLNDVLGVVAADAVTREGARAAVLGAEQAIVMTAGPVSAVVSDVVAEDSAPSDARSSGADKDAGTKALENPDPRAGKVSNKPQTA